MQGKCQICLLIKYRCQVAEEARLCTGYPAGAGRGVTRSWLLGWAYENHLRNFSYQGCSGLVDSLGVLEELRHRPALRELPWGQTVAQCDQSCDGHRDPPGSEEASRKSRQMTWVLKMKRSREGQSRKRRQEA